MSASLEQRLLDARTIPVGSAGHYRAYVGPPDQYDFMGATQFRLLTALGLREEHFVLDIGCGSLRAGRLLIAYLLPGRYIGLDPNKWLIEEAVAEELGPGFIARKQPRFLHSDDFELGEIETPIDYAVAQSVFSHAGPDMLATALAAVANALAPSGQFLFTVVDESCSNFARTPAASTMTGWRYPNCVAYRSEEVPSFCEAAGLLVERLDWFHPRQRWYRAVRDESLLMRNQPVPLESGRVLFDDRF